MEDKAINKALSAPIDLVDLISAQLARVGLDLSPIWLQAVALLLAGFFAWRASLKLRGKKKGKPKPKANDWITAAVLTLLTAGLAIGIGDNAMMPGQVKGKVQSDRPNDVRVSLYGYKDTPISFGADVIDSTDGSFALNYKPLWDGRARKLRISAAGCKPSDSDLYRPQLYNDSLVERTFTCDPV